MNLHKERKKERKKKRKKDKKKERKKKRTKEIKNETEKIRQQQENRCLSGTLVQPYSSIGNRGVSGQDVASSRVFGPRK